MHDYWVGDRVKIKTTGILGTYQADVGSDQALIMTDAGEQICVDTASLTLQPDLPPSDVSSIPTTKPKHKKRAAPLPDYIDLHLDILDPRAEISTDRMLDFQVGHCLEYLKSCITARKSSVTLIHGKGTGILRDMIHQYLADWGKVNRYHLTHDGGATEVWFV